MKRGDGKKGVGEEMSKKRNRKEERGERKEEKNEQREEKRKEKHKKKKNIFICIMRRRQPRSTLLPNTTLFRSSEEWVRKKTRVSEER